MTTPIYPDDATAPVTAFPVVADITYTSTGATTDFNLPTSVDNRGEVVAYVDGVTQSTYSYDISNSGATVSFLILTCMLPIPVPLPAFIACNPGCPIP